MLKHIVMFKLKDFAEGADKGENIQRIKSGLEALPGKIEGIRFFEVGINSIDNGAAYDLVLCSEFDSKEELFKYQKHPEHVKVVGFVNKVCENRVVVDYVI
jgi:Stress responsive A/B Barrel Domain